MIGLFCENSFRFKDILIFFSTICRFFQIFDYYYQILNITCCYTNHALSPPLRRQTNLASYFFTELTTGVEFDSHDSFKIECVVKFKISIVK